MAKVKLGNKWECHACETKFYDFGKAEAICPKCGTDQAADTAEEQERPRGKKKATEKAPKRDEPAKDAADLEDEDEDLDEDEDEDLDEGEDDEEQADDLEGSLGEGDLDDLDLDDEDEDEDENLDDEDQDLDD